MMEDKDELIERLRSEVAEVRLERDGYKVAIAEHVEALGGEGCDGDALRDSLGQLERLLEGEDLDAPMEGVAETLRMLRQAFESLLTVQLEQAAREGEINEALGAAFQKLGLLSKDLSKDPSE